ncbi:6752_t:CDS:2 [Acaulospora colombiana]|uniref:6752_t:CDS:1 n=1 Tax=Acaulospora colombiana TaxID=27376 RepID=A0ACA9LUA9_9GLOM|nr:6752_t:CDS:2 [Acaulospora colombiana]
MILIFVTRVNSSLDIFPIGASTIPYEYRLRFKNHLDFDYVIESSFTEVNNAEGSQLTVEGNEDIDNLYSHNTREFLNFRSRASSRYFSLNTRNEGNFLKRAEILSHPWTLENFKVLELRQDQSGNDYKALTVTSKLNKPVVDIAFTISNNKSASSEESLLSCDYKITWKSIPNGYIWRKCARKNESDYTRIAYFSKQRRWNFKFQSVDEDINYGQLEYIGSMWNYYAREIIVSESAPFPPIIPAIYTAYCDYLYYLRRNYGRHQWDGMNDFGA